MKQYAVFFEETGSFACTRATAEDALAAGAECVYDNRTPVLIVETEPGEPKAMEGLRVAARMTWVGGIVNAIQCHYRTENGGKMLDAEMTLPAREWARLAGSER